MNIYYDLDRGVPPDQADAFDKWCDEQRKKREKEILSLRDYDTARLTLMKMDKLVYENEDLQKKAAFYKKLWKDELRLSSELTSKLRDNRIDISDIQK